MEGKNSCEKMGNGFDGVSRCGGVEEMCGSQIVKLTNSAETGTLEPKAGCVQLPCTATCQTVFRRAEISPMKPHEL